MGEVRIGPGPDAARSLEHLQREADDVEQGDGLEFVQRLQPAPDHASLDGQRRDQQDVIARQPADARAGHEEDGQEEQAHEQAAARFLESEEHEFEQETPRALGLAAQGRRHQPLIEPVQAGLSRWLAQRWRIEE